jgi:hypothetical protein
MRIRPRSPYEGLTSPRRQPPLDPLIATQAITVVRFSHSACGFCEYYMRLLYVDMRHTTYYGIRDSKFRKFLERPFPTPPGHHRLSMGHGFVAQPCDSRSENFPCVLLGQKKTPRTWKRRPVFVFLSNLLLTCAISEHKRRIQEDFVIRQFQLIFGTAE